MTFKIILKWVKNSFEAVLIYVSFFLWEFFPSSLDGNVLAKKIKNIYKKKRFLGKILFFFFHLIFSEKGMTGMVL